MNVIETINTLRETKGTNAKLDVLKSQKDSVILKNFLKAVYDPLENFYVRAFELGTPAEIDYTDEEVNRILDFTTLLSSRQYTGDTALNNLKEFSSTLSADGQALLKILINRNIQAGVKEVSINKIWPTLIHIEPYQRCVLENKVGLPFSKWNRFVSQLKADGMFASLNMSDNLFGIAGRSGLPFPLSAPIMKIIDAARVYAEENLFPIYKGKECTLEGELLVYKDGKRLPREEGNGILNSILQDGEELGEEYEIRFKIWDIVPTVKRQLKGAFQVGYLKRFEVLEQYFGDQSGLVSTVETKIVDTIDEAIDHFLDLVHRGEEGSIVKHPNAEWSHGDNNLQVKLKIVAECDLLLKGFNAADPTSKHIETFGSLQLVTSDGKLEVGCTGIKDEERAKIHSLREALEGTAIVTIKFNDIMIPKKEGELYSLFLPRYVEIRSDKTTADTLERVYEQFEDAKKRLKNGS